MLRVTFAVTVALCSAIQGGAMAQKPTPDQAKFIEIVSAGQHAYKTAANDMAAGGTRVVRKVRLCRELPARAVKDWIGTIKTLSTANDGRGVLVIAVAKDVSIGTFNNSFSDHSYRTLIAPGSPVFNAAVSMKVGEKVEFSGSFVVDDDDCMKETSISLAGSMTAPTFLFRFTSVRKAPTPPKIVGWRLDRGSQGECGVIAKVNDSGNQDHILFGYIASDDQFAVTANSEVVSGGLQIDDMPRLALRCARSGCLPQEGGQARLLAQMRGGRAVFVDVQRKAGDMIGPVKVPLDGFNVLMDQALACGPKPK